MQWCKWAGGWSSRLSRQVRGVARVVLNYCSEVEEVWRSIRVTVQRAELKTRLEMGGYVVI